jgi:hypothetical protein
LFIPFAFACSAKDPGSPVPRAWNAGGPSTDPTGDNSDGPPKQAPPSTRPPQPPELGPDATAPTGTGPSPTDASAPPHDAGGIGIHDAGGIGIHDAGGSAVEAGTPTGALGTCGNPDCFTQGADCFCTATASDGTMIQLGCESGGACGCFDNGQLDNNTVVNEVGTCADPSAQRALFASTCGCH